ncbi:MAG: Asp-tRNA(Asn)/Glu-tRNA(Gln) amidotransferase subunit GatA [candidate division WS1 bacterium]|jgi:aspartyl-tRNA(Asn)/glutamyl-tRNA(Gln) amidotransferase subunit A|nr:Asp-tRNA(Asn)/Glu-tRNA(Gln) amidotransferase subunit GatA [candidate division WS1 bacterium]
MAIHDMTAWQLTEQLQARQITAVEAVQACYDRIDTLDGQVKAFLTLTRESALEQARAIDSARAAGEKLPPTAGLPIAHKDGLSTAAVRTTCASRMLDNYVPAYDATVVKRCHDAGMIMLGKTNMDEFAMGSSGENSAFQVTANPWDLTRIPGGSSSGSAAAVAAGEAFVATGSDTGGSIRQPAALCGLIGLKPTYGRVSRYGLIAYGSSLDTVGPLCRDVRDAALIMNVIAGHDPRDATSSDVPVPDYTTGLGADLDGLRAGVVQEILHHDGVDPTVRQTVEQAIEHLSGLGVEIEEIHLPHVEYSQACYGIIAPAEASSNLARLDGVRYGYRTDSEITDIHDLFAKSRAESLGPEVQLRIIRGTYVLSAGQYDAYYMKALKVRTLIKQELESALERHDFLISPTSPVVASSIGEKTENSMVSRAAATCTKPVNLAGLPAINVPCGLVNGLPVGMQVIGRPFDEARLLQVAYAYEQATEWHRAHPEL